MSIQSIPRQTQFMSRINALAITTLFCLFATVAHAQNMDEKIKTLANEIADQVVKGSKKKVAVASLLYKDCSTEFGNLLAEKLTGRLAVSGRNMTVVNQRLLESLLAQNKLSVTGILETKNEAAKLGQVSGIDALVYGTISGSGDEVQLTLNIITLSTLNVFGFAETSFPLTQGIKSMLPCIEGKASTSSNSQNVSDDRVPTNTNSTVATLAKPSADCAAKFTCVICATNKSATNVKANIHWWNPSYYLHPGETKCWQDVTVDRNTGFSDRGIRYLDDNNGYLKEDNFVVESCKVYNRVLTK